MSTTDDNFSASNPKREKQIAIVANLLGSFCSVLNATMLKYIVSKLEVNFADTLFFRFIFLFVFTAFWTKQNGLDVF